MRAAAAGRAAAADAPQARLREVARGSAVTLVGVGLHQVLQYGVWLVVSRFWGAGGLGLFATGVAALTVWGGLVRLGLAQGTLRYVAVLQGRDRGGDARPLLLRLGALAAAAGLAGGIVLLAASGALARLVDKPALAPVLAAVGAGLFLWNLLNVAFSALQGLRAMAWLVAVRDLAQPGLAAAAVLGVGVAGGSIAAATAAYVGSMAVGIALAAGALRRLLPPPPPRPAPPPVREVLRYSLPLTLNQVLHVGVRQQEVFLLAYFVSAAQVGLYGAGLKTAAIVGFVLQATNAIFAPVIAQLHGNRELDLLRRTYATVCRWCFTLGLPFFLVCLVFGREVLLLWGPEFGAGWLVLVVLAAGQLANLSTSAAGTLLVMGERQKVELANSVCALLLGLGLDLALIPRLGILGAAVAAGASLAAVNALRAFQVRRLWGATPFGAGHWKPLVAGAAALALAWIARRWLIAPLALEPGLVALLGTVLLCGAYGVGLAARGVEEADRDVARGFAGRLARGRRPRPAAG